MSLVWPSDESISCDPNCQLHTGRVRWSCYVFQLSGSRQNLPYWGVAYFFIRTADVVQIVDEKTTHEMVMHLYSQAQQQWCQHDPWPGDLSRHRLSYWSHLDSSFLPNKQSSNYRLSVRKLMLVSWGSRSSHSRGVHVMGCLYSFDVVSYEFFTGLYQSNILFLGLLSLLVETKATP